MLFSFCRDEFIEGNVALFFLKEMAKKSFPISDLPVKTWKGSPNGFVKELRLFLVVDKSF